MKDIVLFYSAAVRLLSYFETTFCSRKEPFKSSAVTRDLLNNQARNLSLYGYPSLPLSVCHPGRWPSEDIALFYSAAVRLLPVLSCVMVFELTQPAFLF